MVLLSQKTLAVSRWSTIQHLKGRSKRKLTRAVLGGGAFLRPLRFFADIFLKNGGAQRRCFWHILSYIFSA